MSKFPLSPPQRTAHEYPNAMSSSVSRFAFFERPDWVEEILQKLYNGTAPPPFRPCYGPAANEIDDWSIEQLSGWEKSGNTEINWLDMSLARRQDELKMLQQGKDPYTSGEKSRLDSRERANFEAAEKYIIENSDGDEEEITKDRLVEKATESYEIISTTTADIVNVEGEIEKILKAQQNTSR